MAKPIHVQADPCVLEDYLQRLIKHRARLCEELEELKRAFRNADWNDAVAEKARNRLNEQIDNFNRAMQMLSGVIDGLAKKLKELDDYYNHSIKS